MRQPLSRSRLIYANGQAVERRRDSARQLGLKVGVEVVVSEVREIRPVGPDLARESAEAYRNLAVYANVVR